MKLPLALRSVSLAALALPASAQTLLQTHTGSVGDEFGYALLQTADQNGDGYVDILVGAPGWNSDRGYIRCISGKYLAMGAGSFVLWTLYSTANAGARFGSSLAEVGTLTGNSATDFVVGAPGVTSTGALMLVDGATHAVAWTMTGELNTRLGTSIAAVGDQDGDGKVDIAASAPRTGGLAVSSVHVIRGSSFGVATTLQSSQHITTSAGPFDEFGAAIASGFDLDHDGRFDLAIGSPDVSSDDGYIAVYRVNSSFTFLAGLFGPLTGERFGSSIDGSRDFDGDGFNDLVVGSPHWSATGARLDGRASVVSGQRLLTNTSPQELFEMRCPFNSYNTYDVQFGTCVRASSDLNADGVPDVIVGAPGFSTLFNPPGYLRGGAGICSGASGALLGLLGGNPHDELGLALLGAIFDMNADGFAEFAVAGPPSDTSTADCGTLKFYSLFPSYPSTYCTAKTNSLGCFPSMGYSGTASANPSTAFSISCSSVINQVSGLLFYSHAPTATPFQGGTLCVKSPLRRTSVLSSGGSASGTDCSGSFNYDFGARIHSGVDATLVAGSQVFVQCWSRDTASPSTTSLSNALRFVINP